MVPRTGLQRNSGSESGVLASTLDVLWGDYTFTADTTDGVRRVCLKPGQTFHLVHVPNPSIWIVNYLPPVRNRPGPSGTGETRNRPSGTSGIIRHHTRVFIGACRFSSWGTQIRCAVTHLLVDGQYWLPENGVTGILPPALLHPRDFGQIGGRITYFKRTSGHALVLVHTSGIFYSFGDAFISPSLDPTHGLFLWSCGMIIILALHVLAPVKRSEYEKFRKTQQQWAYMMQECAVTVSSGGGSRIMVFILTTCHNHRCGALSVPLCYASGARGGCKPLGAKQHGRINDDWFGTQAYLLYSMDRATGAEVDIPAAVPLYYPTMCTWLGVTQLRAGGNPLYDCL
ncbi:uncharacterized protein An16g04380 [Aspergillus niger]|uniref:Contig An16c0160, genomic contig n=2 Tax=Aspergillus niger TaxID=5061 RepID=A2R7Q7_ASPNC|nr:uncharacterized protein An16g04380 [Aspergillus niger]CAK46855.1 unnamed protein product [Aspergillus niger]